MAGDNRPAGDPPRYPADLRLIDTTLNGYVVSADGARTYLDIAPAWQLMRRLVHPLLNAEPEGNC